MHFRLTHIDSRTVQIIQGGSMDDQITTAIGTELLFENHRIRVWNMVLQLGERIAASQRLG